MSGTFADLITSDVRLVVLRCLAEDPGYDLNESMVQSMLEAMGHNMSRDRVRTELAWLAEQGLVTLASVMSVVVATLTARGADVAAGRSTVPGVKRPRPGV